MKFFLTFSLFLIIFYVHSQAITIEGTVLNQQTQQPVSYANISIKNKPLGTVCNEEGFFKFHSSELLEEDIVVVSAIGFTSIEKTVKELITDSLNIFNLKAVTFQIADVNINNLTVDEIIKKAKRQIDKSFSEQPFRSECFYYENIQENNSYVRAIEAALDVYDDNKMPLMQIIPKQTFKVMNVKYNVEEKESLAANVSNLGLLYSFLFKNPRLQFLDTEGFTQDSLSVFGNSIVYVLSKNTPNSKITLFIDHETFNIKKISNFSKNQVKISISKNTTVLDTIKYEILYQEINNFVYPKLINMTVTFQILQEESNNLLSYCELNSELLYSNIKTELVTEIEEDEQWSIFEKIEKPIEENNSFWEYFNKLEETLEKMEIKEIILN